MSCRRKDHGLVDNCLMMPVVGLHYDIFLVVLANRLLLALMAESAQICDLDEALLVISLKNDEIGNLRSSIRATEKKHSLKLTDLQFRVDQERGRCAELERKLAKAEEGLRKAAEEQKRQAQGLVEVQAQARRRERELKAAVFEGQLHLQREREMSGRLAGELEVLQRYFDPRKILPALQKKSLEELPSYLQLHRRNAQRAEEVRQLGLEMDRLRSETYLGMEETFKKLSSYEAVMESLNHQNRQLEESIREKEEELQLHSLEIDQKSQLLEEVKVQAIEQVEDLNDQLHTLREYYAQALPDGETTDPTHPFEYHRAIEELQAAVEEGEARFSEMQGEYEERIAQLREEKQTLKKELLGMQGVVQGQKEDFEAVVAAERREIAEKDDMIVLLSNSIKEQEDFFENKQAEFDRYLADLSELLSMKKRTEEELRESEAVYRSQVESLTDELTHLRRHFFARQPSLSDRGSTHELEQYGDEGHRLLQRARSGLGSVRSFDGGRNNLLAELRDESGDEERRSRVDIGSYEREPNWSELYYALLKKHNDFARRVQDRLQAMASGRRAVLRPK